MSAVIKTTTPFTIQEVLLEALEAVGAEPETITTESLQVQSHRGGLKVGDILTNRTDYNGPQHFRFEGGRWILRHDSDEMNGIVTAVGAASREYRRVAQFLASVSKEYGAAYQRHLDKLAEQERARVEEARKARVEATRKQVITNAKAQGYSVKEVRNGNKIQVVLTRTV
jgi:uncharacterized protein YbaA (DUF1428 family)